jgi:ribonuclease HI
LALKRKRGVVHLVNFRAINKTIYILTKKLMLFIDGSANNQLKSGCGAYLVLNENEVINSSYAEKVNIKTFNDTSSTKLELQTLLWALSELTDTRKSIMVYTDSQNIIGLQSRRASLEKNDYHSGNNRLLNHHALYREFFKMMDQIDCEFVKVTGHQPTKHKDSIDRLFTLVDRAARKASRNLRS